MAQGIAPKQTGKEAVLKSPPTRQGFKPLDSLGGARSSARTSLAPPKFDPIDYSGVNKIKSRLSEVDRLAADPLSSPGAASTIAAINTQFARRAESERGQALGRAADSGQAGFQGSLAQTSADIVSRQSEASAAEQANLALELTKQYRQEGMSLTEALTAANNDIARIMTERESIVADFRAREAELQQRQQEQEYMRLLEQARLAEQTREFDLGYGLDKKRFDADERRYREGFNYQQRRDDVEDSRYKEGFRYQQERDKVGDTRYAEEQKQNDERYDDEFLTKLYQLGLLDESEAQERLDLPPTGGLPSGAGTNMTDEERRRRSGGGGVAGLRKGFWIR